MRIKIWDRLILLFGALIALFSGLVGLFLGIRLNGNALVAPLWQVLSLVLGSLSVCLSAVLFSMFKRFSQKRYAFVVQHTDNGELRIAVAAIENLVQKCIDMHEEIHVNQMQIRHSREGVTVELAITLANNISIPLAVASLQKQIKQYLVASSGIDVKEVRVCVESTQMDGEAFDPASPYLVPADAPATPAHVKGKEKKMPLHRRLFCKADQTATVPEPPKAEETEVSQDIPLPQEAPLSTEEDIPQEQVADGIPNETDAVTEEIPLDDATPVAEMAESTAQDPEKEEGSLG